MSHDSIFGTAEARAAHFAKTDPAHDAETERTTAAHERGERCGHEHMSPNGHVSCWCSVATPVQNAHGGWDWQNAPSSDYVRP